MLLTKKLPFRSIFRDIRRDIGRVLLISVLFQLVQHFYLRFLPAVPLQLAAVLGSGHLAAAGLHPEPVLRPVVGSAQGVGRHRQRFAHAGAAGTGLRARRRAARRSAGFAAAGRGLPANRLVLLPGQWLRGLAPLHPLEQFLSARELAYVRQHINKPLALVGLHTAQIKSLHEEQALDGWARAQLDQEVLSACGCAGTRQV